MDQDTEDRFKCIEDCLRSIAFGLLAVQSPNGLVQVCAVCRVPATDPHQIGCPISKLPVKILGPEIAAVRPRLLS